jgi:hypothetical protein
MYLLNLYWGQVILEKMMDSAENQIVHVPAELILGTGIFGKKMLDSTEYRILRSAAELK